jgi:prophage maintenance system killer protein
MVEKKEIIKINEQLGGYLSRPSSLDFACDLETKNVYKKNACLIRAIAVDHPFTDFNKSTATLVTLRNFKERSIKCNEDKLIKGVTKIAKKNITNLNKIEGMLRKWCK